jgi:endoribonuclease Dicer
LITRHLYDTFPDLSPGMLTDLRSAAVNNENFARVAVNRGLHHHLRHRSAVLLQQVRGAGKAATKTKEILGAWLLN